VYPVGEHLIYALNDVSVPIRAGEFVAVMGPSGSGKSTLMNIIGCLDRPTSGTYYVDGIEVAGLPDIARARLRRMVFGFIFQSYNLIPRSPALQQVELPLMYQRASDRRRRALEALALVGLSDRAWQLPSQMSGGEQQRVAIARSLVVNPRIVVADEPTGALDSRTSNELMEVFTRLTHERGITVVMVTHEPDVAKFSSRLIRMRDGQVVEDVPTNQAFPGGEVPLAPATVAAEKADGHE
jgi:putative ABC transport system ATP-binding protein